MYTSSDDSLILPSLAESDNIGHHDLHHALHTPTPSPRDSSEVEVQFVGYMRYERQIGRTLGKQSTE